MTHFCDIGNVSTPRLLLTIMFSWPDIFYLLLLFFWSLGVPIPVYGWRGFRFEHLFMFCFVKGVVFVRYSSLFFGTLIVVDPMK